MSFNSPVSIRLSDGKKIAVKPDVYENLFKLKAIFG